MMNDNKDQMKTGRVVKYFFIQTGDLLLTNNTTVVKCNALGGTLNLCVSTSCHFRANNPIQILKESLYTFEMSFKILMHLFQPMLELKSETSQKCLRKYKGLLPLAFHPNW